MPLSSGGGGGGSGRQKGGARAALQLLQAIDGSLLKVLRKVV